MQQMLFNPERVPERVSEAQPGLALVDDGDALRRRIDHAAHETPRRVAQALRAGCTRAERRST